MFKTLFHSPLGPLVIIAHDGKLFYCNWDDDDCRIKLEKTERNIPPSNPSEVDKETVSLALCQLKEYFSGKRKSFSLPLHPLGSPFMREVWSQLYEIGYGSKVSYKELGERCGKPGAVRAVANACGANPLAVIIPCHRIIRSDGSLGGYTGGLWRKKKLLELEAW